METKLPKNLEIAVKGLNEYSARFLLLIQKNVISDYYEKIFPIGGGIGWLELIRYLIGFAACVFTGLLILIALPFMVFLIRRYSFKLRCIVRDYGFIVTSIILFIIMCLSLFSILLAIQSNSMLSQKFSDRQSDGFKARSLSSVEAINVYRKDIVEDLKVLKDLSMDGFSGVYENFLQVENNSFQSYLKYTETEGYFNEMEVLFKATKRLEKQYDGRVLRLFRNIESTLNMSRLNDTFYDYLNASEHSNDKSFFTIRPLTDWFTSLISLAEVNTLGENFTSLLNYNLTSMLSEAKRIRYLEKLNTREMLRLRMWDPIRMAEKNRKKVEKLDDVIWNIGQFNVTDIFKTAYKSFNVQFYDNIRWSVYFAICLFIIGVWACLAFCLIVVRLCDRTVHNGCSLNMETKESVIVFNKKQSLRQPQRQRQPYRWYRCKFTCTFPHFFGIKFAIAVYVLSTFLIAMLFLVGGITYTEICRYVQPSFEMIRKTPLADTIDTAVNEKWIRKLNDSKLKNISCVNSILNCKNNTPIYVALDIERQMNLSSELDIKFKVPRITVFFSLIEKDVNYIRENYTGSFTDQLMDLIGRLSEFNLRRLTIHKESIWETKYAQEVYDNINDNLTRHKFHLFLTEYTHLQNQSIRLERLLHSYVNEFYQKINWKSFQHRIQKQNEFIKTHLNVKIGKEFLKAFGHVSEAYRTKLLKLKRFIFGQMGRCFSIYKAVDNISDFICTDTIRAFNAFWTAIGINLVLLLPSICITAFLTTLIKTKYKSVDNGDKDGGDDDDNDYCYNDKKEKKKNYNYKFDYNYDRDSKYNYSSSSIDKQNNNNNNNYNNNNNNNGKKKYKNMYNCLNWLQDALRCKKKAKIISNSYNGGMARGNCNNINVGNNNIDCDFDRNLLEKNRETNC